MPHHSEHLSRLMPLIQHAISHLGALSTESGRRYSLSNTRMSVLSTVMHAEQLRMSDLADSLGLPRPLATRTVDELVARGLLERYPHPGDRRVVLVRPSGTGRTVYEDIQRESSAVLKEVLNDMTPQEADALLVGLEALLNALHTPGRLRSV